MAKNYADVEYYEYNSYPPYERLHGDFIHDVEVGELPDEFPCDCVAMDEEDYNNILLPNCGDTADFADYYGDKEAKVLVVMFRHGAISEYEDATEEGRSRGFQDGHLIMEED